MTEELAQQVADGLTLQIERVNQPAVTAVASIHGMICSGMTQLIFGATVALKQ